MLPDLRSGRSHNGVILGGGSTCSRECSPYKGTFDVFHKVIRQVCRFSEKLVDGSVHYRVSNKRFLLHQSKNGFMVYFITWVDFDWKVLGLSNVGVKLNPVTPSPPKKRRKWITKHIN